MVRQQPVRTYTELDLRLGLVQLDPDQLAVIRTKVAPILGRVVRRLLQEQGGKSASQAAGD